MRYLLRGRLLFSGPDETVLKDGSERGVFVSFAVVAKCEANDAGLGMLGDPGDGKSFSSHRAGARGENVDGRALGILFVVV